MGCTIIASIFCICLQCVLGLDDRSPVVQGEVGGLEITGADIQGLLLGKAKQSVDKILDKDVLINPFETALLLGEANRRLSAARIIMGNKLADPQFKEFAKGLEEQERAIEKMSHGVAHTKKLATQLASGLEELPRVHKKLKSAVTANAGMLGWHRPETSEAKTDFVKRVESSMALDTVEDKLAQLPSSEIVSKIFKGADDLFKQSMAKMAAELDLKALTDQQQDAQKSLTVAVADAQKKDADVRKAGRAVQDANALLAEYQKARADKNNIGEYLSDQISKKQDQLGEIEDRLRRYTYNMFGWRTYMWENDVKLASKEKDEKLKKIQALSEKLAHHKQMDASPDGAFAKVQADAKYAEDELKKTQVAYAQAEENVRKHEKEVRDAIGELMKVAEASGVMDPRQALQVKIMMARVKADAQTLHKLEQMKTDPLESFVTKIKLALKEMRDAEYLDEQADVLAELTDMAEEGLNMSGNAAILWLYQGINSVKFANLMTLGKPSTSVRAGEGSDDTTQFMQLHPEL